MAVQMAKQFRVPHMLVDLGWVDFDFACPAGRSLVFVVY